MSRALRSPSGCCACAYASVPESAPEDGEQCCDLSRTASDEASTRYAKSEAGASTATPSSWCRPPSSAASVCSDALDEAFHLEEDFQGSPAVHQQACASQVVYYVGSFLLTDASAPQPPWRRESSEPLQASASSWVAQRRSRLQGMAMDRDQRVACLVKSTMNKLTAENLPRLSQQLAQCIETERHMQHLVSVVFEAASASKTTFIEMYADLAVVLHKHFEQRRVTDGAGRPVSFKRLLMLECSQALAAISQEPADVETAMKYKDQSLGSMKLVGALCARGLLASSVFLAVSEHLLSADTAEMLESLAALLTIAGPVFDSSPDFEQKEPLEGLFASLKDIAGATTRHDTRTRCLLSDVLDLRANGWRKKSGQQ